MFFIRLRIFALTPFLASRLADVLLGALRASAVRTSTGDTRHGAAWHGAFMGRCATLR